MYIFYEINMDCIHIYKINYVSLNVGIERYI